MCPQSIKFLETCTRSVVQRAVKALRVIRGHACLSAVRGGPVKRLAGRWREDRGGRWWEMVPAISIPSSPHPTPHSSEPFMGARLSSHGSGGKDSGSKGERQQKVEGQEKMKEEGKGAWKCCF